MRINVIVVCEENQNPFKNNNKKKPLLHSALAAGKSAVISVAWGGGGKPGFGINFPLSFTAALQGSLSEKRGTSCCSKIPQTWVSQASL